MKAITYLAQADLLLLIAEMLAPPDSWTAERGVRPEDARALADRSALTTQPNGVTLLQRALAEWNAADPAATAAEHCRLFDGPLVSPPNETIYIRRDKGAVLADIAGFYRAFRFEISDEFREKHDHIIAELQFVSMLLVLIGRAAESDQQEHRNVAQAALVAFLGDHLGLWIGSFAEALEESAGTPFYEATARLVSAAWKTLKTAHGLDELADVGYVGEAVEDGGTPYECGMCVQENRDAVAVGVAEHGERRREGNGEN